MNQIKRQSLFLPPICVILGNTENPEKQYHTSLTASSETTVALIIQ